jgi:hypothetical protein
MEPFCRELMEGGPVSVPLAVIVKLALGIGPLAVFRTAVEDTMVRVSCIVIQVNC